MRGAIVSEDQVDSPRAARRRWLLVGGAIAVIAVVVLVVWLAQPRDTAPGDASPTSSATPTASVTPSETAPASPTPDPDPQPTEEPEEGPPTVETDLDAVETIASDVQISLAPLEAVEGESEGPGAIAGPAVRVTVRVQNNTSEPFDLSAAVVNLDYGADRTPASEASGPGAVSFPASVGPGEQVEAVFVFTVGNADRDVVRVTVDAAGGEPVIVYSGAAPRSN